MPLPTEMDARAFRIDTVPYGPHKFDFVSVETGHIEDLGDPNVTPPDRMQRVAQVIGRNSLTVVAYFPPELEGTDGLSGGAFQTPFEGPLAKLLRPGQVYNQIADICHNQKKPIGVADITNRPAFRLYGLYFLPLAYLEHAIGNHKVVPRQRERLFPTATDARRLLTAAALLDETDRHPEGKRIAYIAAPAHVNRVRQYVTATEWGCLDRFRLATYHRLPGIDTNLRIYRPKRRGWRKAERYPIVGSSLGSYALASANNT